MSTSEHSRPTAREINDTIRYTCWTVFRRTGIAPSADEERHWRQRFGVERDVVELEMLTSERHVVLAAEQFQNLQRFVRPRASRLRVDATARELVRILATDTHSKDETPHAELV